jgi:hypothetical protein
LGMQMYEIFYFYKRLIDKLFKRFGLRTIQSSIY